MNHNATIIDHVFINSFDNKRDARILAVDISDHFPTSLKYKSINVKTDQDPVFCYKI